MRTARLPNVSRCIPEVPCRGVTITLRSHPCPDPPPSDIPTPGRDLVPEMPTHPRKGHGTKDTHPPPTPWTERRLWKHCLSGTSMAGGNYAPNHKTFFTLKRQLQGFCQRNFSFEQNHGAPIEPILNAKKTLTLALSMKEKFKVSVRKLSLSEFYQKCLEKLVEARCVETNG